MKNQIISKKGKTLIQLIVAIGLLIFNVTPQVFGQEKIEAQVEKKVIEIKLTGGTKLRGELISDNEDHFIIGIEGDNKATILKSKIKSFRIFVAGKNGRQRSPGSGISIISPSGYGLKKGEGSYQNLMFVANHFNYGITDYFSMGIGFESFSLLAEAQLPYFVVTPKFSIPLKKGKWNVGIGAFIGGDPTRENSVGLSAVYGSLTYGSREKHLTISVGVEFTQENSPPNPIAIISGIRRVHNKWSLLTDNWLTTEGNSPLIFNSLGFRYIGNRTAFDFSLVGVTFENNAYFSSDRNSGEYRFVIGPMVGFTVALGKSWRRPRTSKAK